MNILWKNCFNNTLSLMSQQATVYKLLFPALFVDHLNLGNVQLYNILILLKIINQYFLN